MISFSGCNLLASIRSDYISSVFVCAFGATCRQRFQTSLMTHSDQREREKDGASIENTSVHAKKSVHSVVVPTMGTKRCVYLCALLAHSVSFAACFYSLQPKMEINNSAYLNCKLYIVLVMIFIRLLLCWAAFVPH